MLKFYDKCFVTIENDISWVERKPNPEILPCFAMMTSRFLHIWKLLALAEMFYLYDLFERPKMPHRDTLFNYRDLVVFLLT